MGGAGVALCAGQKTFAAVPDGMSPELMRLARGAVAQHRSHLSHVDRIGIVDFSRPSNRPRLFIINMNSGRSDAYLVAHGRGSDPAHTGWLKHFSNEFNSLASSRGAFVTGSCYVGTHGRSMHLTGLDRQNSNAAARQIVVHAAPYVSSQIARDTGVLGRSEGCFAVAPTSRDAVLSALGPGRLLYAARI
ncbi:MAG: hypothetical protein JWO15_1164 [Sphingomonadales bacterium]|nr:hypothetical protein [Sphingomonadales bacterium]